MNKKGFILLAAALTGATTLAVGAVAISGANQMNRLSVNTSAANYKIKDFVATNQATETNADEYYFYHTPVTFSGKTGYYEENFVSSSSFVSTYSEDLTVEYPGEGDEFLARYSEGAINDPGYDPADRFGYFNFYIGFEFEANGEPIENSCYVEYNTYDFNGAPSSTYQKAYFDIDGSDGYYLLEADMTWEQSIWLENTYTLEITKIVIEYSCNI